MNSIGVRPMREGEQDQIAAIWYRAGRDAYPYLAGWQAMTAELARDVFSRVIAPSGRVFVAVRFGTSPPPESAPDVEYHWRP